MTSVALELIDNIARLEQFLPEWWRFLEPNVLFAPFQTPAWLVTWWSHFGSGDLHVLAFRQEGRLVGVVPCFLHEWNSRRQLTLIGTGVSDYLDPPIDPRHASAVVETLRRHLTDWSDWEVCNWQDLSAGTPLLGLGPTIDDAPCSRIALATSIDEYMANRPHGLKRNLRRYREKAEAIAPLEFSVTCQADPDLLTALIELHRARWRRSGDSGMIDANRSARFLREASNAMAAHDMLRIFALRFEQRVAAIVLAFRHETTMFAYLSGFDPEYESFGCGRLLLARALEYAQNDGYRCWDFLRGDEPYKFDWGAEPVPKCRLVLERSAL